MTQAEAATHRLAKDLTELAHLTLDFPPDTPTWLRTAMLHLHAGLAEVGAAMAELNAHLVELRGE